MSSDGIGDQGLSFEDFLGGRRESAEAPGRGAAIVPPPPENEALHGRILGNLRRLLVRQLRGESHTVLPVGTTVHASGNVGDFEYQPDVVVDAQEWNSVATVARQPLVVVEVATAGSERAGFVEKWQIYRSLPTVGVHVLADPEGMSITVRRRKGDAWEEETLTEADDQVFLPTIHALLPLAEIYAEAAPEGGESVEFGNVILS